ncbi:MAG: acyltransferase [Planctomycetota bacterium]|nr:acyltransferase [Planctomycetota bacterium]
MPLVPRPKWLQLNSTAGPAGMSLFFSLSGFLITAALVRKPAVWSFLVRRLCRIVPLAVVGAWAILLLQSAPASAYPPLLFYYYNYTAGVAGVSHVSHFWSLCVEMHFYLIIALSVAALGSRGLLLVPALAVIVTGLRVANGVYIDIATHYRVDEILAGSILALCVFHRLSGAGNAVLWCVARMPQLLLVLAFAASCHPATGPAQYLRPYLGAALVGSTLTIDSRLSRFLGARPLRYIAEISYALYVFHPATMMGWMGSGETLLRYLKRPLSLLLTFALAHLSTYYFEKPLTNLGRRLARRLESSPIGEGGDSAPVESGANRSDPAAISTAHAKESCPNVVDGARADE